MPVQTRSQTSKRPAAVPESRMSASKAKDTAASAGGAKDATGADNGDGGSSNSPLRWLIRVAIIAFALYSAYHIRLYAIKNYGLVIHEFDPWFNYRATVYLRDHGIEKFFKWYDHKVWYPLGRPVGTTIYPGMQLTSVAIWNALGADDNVMSLNDVCCYVPAWFGVLATAFLGLLCYECTGSADAGALSALVMAVVPAHIMRSVGGGYDNESIAMTAMCATFYFWARSLRGNSAVVDSLRKLDDAIAKEGAKAKNTLKASRKDLLEKVNNSSSWVFGVVAGLAYIYMVAAWGGYIFVLNMIAFHAVALVAMGRYTPKLHKAYTLFYLIGTYGAIQVPVVGLTPLKSMEQLGALGVFGIIQLMWIASIVRDIRDPDHKWDAQQVLTLRAAVFGAAAVASVIVIIILAPTGYFGPLSSRVRGLFVQHTRTGNPLVDSVAEHQPASAGAYFQYLHFLFYMYPIGMGLCYFKPSELHGDSKLFVVLYGVVAYYFSSKMVRLVLLMGPIGSIFGGITLANGIEWGVRMGNLLLKEGIDGPIAPTSAELASSAKKTSSKRGKKEKRVKRNAAAERNKELDKIMEPVTEFLESPQGHTTRKFGGVLLLAFFGLQFSSFWRYSQRMAENMSQPSIMFKARLRDGSEIMVDDYREAYWWLRDNTPEDSRVMAWWDYGYQINGIAERTSIADGNTWNHEHIATLGRCLTSPEKRAHRIVRHLADYVLVWAGGGGDDLAKSPHMARIGNSVYNDICPGDPTCRRFGFNKDGSPTPMMAASLLYRLHSHNLKPGVKINPDLFEHVFSSKYGKVRIFRVKGVSQKSKKWIADPANLLCDAPGSWYCVGQYPPALDLIMAKKRSFAQLEDWNKKRSAEDDEYQKEYMARMSGINSGGKRSSAQKRRESEALKEKRKAEKKREEESDKQDEKEAIEDEKAYLRSQHNEFEEDDDVSMAPTTDDNSDDYDDDEDHFDPNDPVNWRDTDDTTRMWNLISQKRNKELKAWIDEDPDIVHIRSSDGKGPLFWAYEYGNKKLVSLLKKRGIDATSTDSSGHKAKFYKKKKK